MRFLLAAVLVLSACGGKGSPEPAWPKSAGHVPPESWEEDGGESLEPQGDTAVESGGEPEEPVDPEVQALIDEALTSPTTGDTPPATSPEDEMIIIDEGDPPPPDADAPPPPPP